MNIQQVDHLLTLHESGRINRRQLLGTLVVAAVGGRPSTGPFRPSREARRARTLNHVTLSVADPMRSRAFYERLLGLQTRAVSADTTVVGLENGFLALDTYANQQPAEHPRGIDHFCLGIDQYQPEPLIAGLQRDFPHAKAHLEGKQVYLHDPDGATVQLCPTDYQR